MNSQSDLDKTLGVDTALIHGARWKRRVIVALAVVAAALVGVALAGWRKSARSGAVQYQTQAAKRGDLTVIVTATGALEPTNTVEVGSEISGMVKSVEVDYNDRVQVGQVLARIDTSKLESQTKQSRAALEASEAKVLQTQATVRETAAKLDQLRRVQKLSNGKVPAQAELDAAEAALARARADLASAQAAVSQARATVETNETDLGKCVIRSPVRGIVLSRDIEPGQTVAASFTAPVLFTLAEDLSQMKLVVNVDEADVGQVREGQPATFTVDAYPNRTFSARIIQARYGSQTVDGVVTYQTILKVNNPDLCLRPGMTATADLVVQKIEDTVLVPNTALRFAPPDLEQQAEPSGGVVGALLPHPPRPPSFQPPAEDADKTHRKVWTVRSGQLTPLSVTVGVTDGTMTQVVQGEVQPGTEVVVDSTSQKR